MRYLGIDLGDKRTGLATGDNLLRLAVPSGVLEIPADREGGEALLTALRQVIDVQLGTPLTTGEIVVGLPLNMDGTEGPRARRCREFAVRLAGVTGRHVHLQDERLSTASADWSMARTGLTHKQKKARRDAIAAAALLQGFLGALPPDPEHALREEHGGEPSSS
jgi:putative Holliday junction resolvase